MLAVLLATHAPAFARTYAPRYTNTIMPNGVCNISSQDGIQAANPVVDNAHVIATFRSPHYGTHVLALGRDAKLYHKHQTSPDESSKWSAWKCITPDLTKVPCSTAPRCGGYDSNPVVQWQPVNGTAVVFLRQQDDLDIHETHLMDPTDPDSWSPMREPACICNFPPCVDRPGKPDQTKCGVEANCDNKGVDCSLKPTSSRDYWNTQPAFPTSDLSLLPEGDLLALYFRGFDGAYYKMSQLTAGDAGGKFGIPNRLGGLDSNDPNAVIE